MYIVDPDICANISWRGSEVNNMGAPRTFIAEGDVDLGAGSIQIHSFLGVLPPGIESASACFWVLQNGNNYSHLMKELKRLHEKRI